MLKDKKDVIKLAKEFVNLCKQNNIWYVVDNGSLLGAIREKGMISWDDDFDVMMTQKSYLKLKKLFPNRVIDNDDKKYPLTIPKFMIDKTKFLESAVFVDIFIVIPTTIKKVKKYRTFKNKVKFSIQVIHSDWKPFNLSSKIFKIISFPFKSWFKKITLIESVDILQVKSKNIEGYFTIDNPIDPFKINWQESLSFKTEKINFQDFEVNIPIEYHKILINKYGKDYMTPNKHARSIEHINAISIVKVKR